MNDKKLWKVFSEYIRLRDADEQGFCKCFTCGFTANWKRFDCGHGIGRQHLSVKYNEQNNHAQCKRCNGFEGGMRERYKEEMNKRYGPDTWDLMEIASKRRSKISQTEIDIMETFYKSKLQELIRA